MGEYLKGRRFRLMVSAVALISLNVQPVLAQNKGKDVVLNACAAEREGLIKLDREYGELKRSKTSAALGQGLKQGAAVLAKGVMSGGLGRSSGGFGSALGGIGGMMSAVGSMAAQQQAQSNNPQAAPSSASLFGPDMLSSAMGLNVPGIGGGDMKGYAALAVLVAIVATAEAYAQLKEQEAGGDLRKASFNIDQDAAKQLTVARQIANDGNALVDCRTRQIADVNTRFASAANDKDRRAVRRERTELLGALKNDVDLTGGVVEQHTGMTKTFTQGRAMTDGTSEADVLGGQAPAYAPAPSMTRLSMPKAGSAPSSGSDAQVAAAPAPAAGPLVAIRATVVRSAPVASAEVLMNLPVGREVRPKSAKADGGWWEIDVAGSPGYVRAADLGPPGSAPAPVQTAARGKTGRAAPAAKAPPPPPAPAGPTNIRAYNQQVIAARDTGKGRLSSLMTDIQTSQRRDSVLYAFVSNWRWG